jgi:hypothetical protein
MAIIEILPSLENQINKKFKKESIKIFELFKTLKDNPKKGKKLGHVGNIAIKELKYSSFRFYFITDNYKVQFLLKEELTDLLIKFVRMSDKKNQQQTIDEIKIIILKLGIDGLI